MNDFSSSVFFIGYLSTFIDEATLIVHVDTYLLLLDRKKYSNYKIIFIIIINIILFKINSDNNILVLHWDEA